MPLEAPRLVAPPEGAVLTFFPRHIDFEWMPVADARRYGIEVDCYHCCARDRWCSDVNPQGIPGHEVVAPRYTSDFPGDQPGRWRVWAIDARGRPGPKSEWRQFTFYAPPPPSGPASSFRDPVTGNVIAGPGVIGPKPVYSPRASYPERAMKDRITGIVEVDVVVGVDGRVQNALVRRSLRPDLDESAIAAVKMWRFEPARKDGQAITALVTLMMTFNLK